MKEKIKMHMVITGEAITDFARKMFHEGKITEVGKFYEKDSDRKVQAFKMLDGLIPPISTRRKMKIIRGDAYLKGDSDIGVQYVPRPDYKFKYEKTKKDLSNTLSLTVNAMESVTNVYQDNAEKLEKVITGGKTFAEKNEERKKFEEELEEELKSDKTGNVKLEKWTVTAKSLDEYVKAIEWNERAVMMGMARKDPRIGSNALANRINKHKQIFKEAKVKYHGDLTSDRRKHPEPSQLYKLIEKWITENHPELSQKVRMKKAKDEAFNVGMMARRMRGDDE